MLEIYTPKADFSDDISWTVDEIFSRFLSIEFKLIESDKDVYEICYKGKKIIINKTFSFMKDNWLSVQSLPGTCIDYVELCSIGWYVNSYFSDIPILYGDKKIACSDKEIYIGFDIIGTIFFLLSMYSESVIIEKDKHQRVLLENSFLQKSGLYSRPIVNEYIELLRGALLTLWPELKFKKRIFRNIVTCDVDRMYECESYSFFWLIRRTVLNIARGKFLKEAALLFGNYFSNASKNKDENYKNLLWISSKNKEIGNKVIFYFIAGSSSLFMDTCYKINDQIVKGVIKKISKAGHTIGIHLSYNTSQSYKSAFKEFCALDSVLKTIDMSQSLSLSRQHYLKWDQCITPDLLSNLGIKIDSSIGYSNKIGFRVGSCYEYMMFDPVNHKANNIIQQPLILMDVALFEMSNKIFNNIGKYDYMRHESLKMKEICHFYKGDFVVLWHNNQMSKKGQKDIYLELIK